jgi:hypothetical protein
MIGNNLDALTWHVCTVSVTYSQYHMKFLFAISDYSAASRDVRESQGHKNEVENQDN